MEKTIILIIFSSVFMLNAFGCSNPGTIAGNIEKGAAINAAAGVPYAGIISLSASAIDILSRVGKPKVGKSSEQLQSLVSKTPPIIFDSKWNPKWPEYFNYLENNKTLRMKSDQVPQEKLNYKVAVAKAWVLISQGIFSENNTELQDKNIEAWKKGELVVAEYGGLNGVKIVAVSKNNEPFEFMLPEEREQRNSIENK